MPLEKCPGVPNGDQVNTSLPLCFKNVFLLPFTHSEEKISRENTVASYKLEIPSPNKMESHVGGMDDVHWGLHNHTHSEQRLVNPALSTPTKYS